MRLSALVLILGLSSCATMQPPPERITLTPADAATSLAMGGPVSMTIQAPPPSQAPGGEDPLILMTLRSGDGRTMSFDERNHAMNDLIAQRPGGPLSQIMGLPDDAAPKLYGARLDENRGTPFICGPEGPLNLGYYEAADGSVTLYGMKQGIEFETQPDGSTTALPYSPDQICARLHFRRG